MKKMRKLLVVVLAVSMILSLTACSKKAIDADTFEEIMEDKYDCDVDKGYKTDDMDECLLTAFDDGQYLVKYVLYEDAEDAADEFDRWHDQYDETEEDDDFEDKIKVSGSGSYNKLVLKRESDDGIEMYVVMIRSEKMLIKAVTYDTGKKGVKKIEGIIKELGY